MSNYNLISKIADAAFRKGVASEKFKKFRYGSANWRLVEADYESAANELVKLERLFHENFPLTFVETSVE